MTRRVVLAVDGDSPQAIELIEWADANLNVHPKKDASGEEITPADVHVTILHVTLPPHLPDWGFHALFTGEKLWEGMLTRSLYSVLLLPRFPSTLCPCLCA